eukprot:scaffold130279_cov48-Phaeocystis_antarctica.AAC.1
MGSDGAGAEGEESPDACSSPDEASPSCRAAPTAAPPPPAARPQPSARVSDASSSPLRMFERHWPYVRSCPGASGSTAAAGGSTMRPYHTRPVRGEAHTRESSRLVPGVC